MDENSGRGLVNEAGKNGVITSDETGGSGGDGVIHLRKMGINGREATGHVDVLTGKSAGKHVVGPEVGRG